MELRKCCSCQVKKTLESFHRHKGIKLGRTYKCKECFNNEPKHKDKFIKFLASKARGVGKGAYFKIRFDVFKRDSFTCQYCGAKSPDVKLQVDHKVSIKKGGTDDVSNLTTSCWECNIGKGAS